MADATAVIVDPVTGLSITNPTIINEWGQFLFEDIPEDFNLEIIVEGEGLEMKALLESNSLEDAQEALSLIITDLAAFGGQSYYRVPFGGRTVLVDAAKSGLQSVHLRAPAVLPAVIRVYCN